MNTETENNDPSAEDAESLMKIIGYLAIDPHFDAPNPAITNYEPKASPPTSKEIFDLLRNGCLVTVDLEVAEEVKRRIKKPDPENAWDLDGLPASDNTVRLCLGECGDTIAIRLARGPIPSDQEVRELIPSSNENE